MISWPLFDKTKNEIGEGEERVYKEISFEGVSGGVGLEVRVREVAVGDGGRGVGWDDKEQERRMQGWQEKRRGRGG